MGTGSNITSISTFYRTMLSYVFVQMASLTSKIGSLFIVAILHLHIIHALLPLQISALIDKRKSGGGGDGGGKKARYDD